MTQTRPAQTGPAPTRLTPHHALIASTGAVA